ncbi:hypothetical protein Tco_0319054 [Tanacetum coccineum]
MDLNRFVVKDIMIDYVLHKYGSNWQVYAAIADDILDDLLKKNDKRKVTQMKIQDLIEKRIKKDGQHLNKEKQIMHINKGKEKMVMERVTSDESSEDTLKSSSEDTCSSDCTREQKKLLKAVYKGRRGSSFRNAAIIKPEKPKSRSKHLAPTTRIWATCTTLVVPTKRPPLVTNCVLGLAVVTTWQRILNKEFGIISSKEDVGGSSNVKSKGKRKML